MMSNTVLQPTTNNAMNHWVDEANKNSDKDFGHVHKTWAKKCMSYDKVNAIIDNDKKKIEDFRTSLKNWEPVAKNDGIVFKNKLNDREYKATDHAITCMCNAGVGIHRGGLLSMMSNITEKTNEETGKIRDKEDFDITISYLKANIFNPSRVNQQKNRLFRTWSDGTLRAVLSERYSIIDNQWFFDVLSKAIPNGLVSHWRGDADEVYANILIPDTIREEDDSDFGGMFSIGNSEIGTRRTSSTPSVFRAICDNGCILGKKSGNQVSKIHLGKINLDTLKTNILKNLNEQIPLLTINIDNVLKSKENEFGEAPLENLIAQLAIDNILSKKQSMQIYNDFQVEKNVLGNEAKTAYGLSNAITRAGQNFNNKIWIQFDHIGGHIATMEDFHWQKLVNRATQLSDSQVEKKLSL